MQILNEKERLQIAGGRSYPSKPIPLGPGIVNPQIVISNGEVYYLGNGRLIKA